MKLKMKELYINETKMSKKEYDIFIKVDEQKFGFREVALRHNYYGDEDGILMEKQVM